MHRLAADYLFDWRPMNTADTREPVLLRMGNIIVAAIWNDGWWRIGRGRKLLGYPTAWTPIHGPVASERGMS